MFSLLCNINWNTNLRQPLCSNKWAISSLECPRCSALCPSFPPAHNMPILCGTFPKPGTAGGGGLAALNCTMALHRLLSRWLPPWVVTTLLGPLCADKAAFRVQSRVPDVFFAECLTTSDCENFHLRQKNKNLRYIGSKGSSSAHWNKKIRIYVPKWNLNISLSQYGWSRGLDSRLMGSVLIIDLLQKLLRGSS